MNEVYSTILNPYEKEGLKYTNRYKAHGMADAVIITDEYVEKIKDISAESAVIVDICNFSFLSTIRQLSNICIIFTKKQRKPININSLYACDVKTLIIRDSFKNIQKVDIDKMPQLVCLSIRLAAIDVTKKNANLLSLQLDDIGDKFDFLLINNFPNLKNLALKKGKILAFDKINSINCLEELNIERANIKNCNGLDKLSKLKNLSVCAGFGLDITTKLATLKNLQHLKLDYFTQIDNIDWVKELPNLKTIVLGCSIQNGDLSPLKYLQHVRLKIDSPHYNLHDSDLPKDNSIYLKFIDNEA